MTEQKTDINVSVGRDHAGSNSRTRSIVMVGLSVAMIAVCAWVTVPLGPVPFTLQMFAITFAICALPPKQAIAAIFAYEAIGAIGLPVFSGMRGGLGVLAGPTGGFLLGYLVGVPLAVLFLYIVRRVKIRRSDRDKLSRQDTRDNSFRTGGSGMRWIGVSTGIVSGSIAGIIFTACAYIMGCIQYVAITGAPLSVAIATCVLPFVVVDIIKIVAAAICANRVAAALEK